MKLVEILGAAVNKFLPIAYKMAIINYAHLLKHDSKCFNVVVHVIYAYNAKFFAV